MSKRILLFLVIIIIIIFSTSIIDGRERKLLPISSLSIQFNKTNATFLINYDFDEISRIYFLIFGSKSIEPKIRWIFRNFDFDIVKIDQDKTILKVNNISRADNGYYLHDSRYFGDKIIKVYISDSYGTRIYSNINATPYMFYR